MMSDPKSSRSFRGQCGLADQPPLVMMRNASTNELYIDYSTPANASVSPVLNGKRHLRATITLPYPPQDRRLQQVVAVVRLCPCSLELRNSPRYCPIDDDRCGIDMAGELVCWKSSWKRMVGSYFPFVFIWVPLVFLILAMMLRGRLARSYLRRIVCRERPEEQLDSMLRDHPNLVDNIIQRYERRMSRRRARQTRVAVEEARQAMATSAEDVNVLPEESRHAVRVTAHLVLKTKPLSLRTTGTAGEEEEEQTCTICLGGLQEGTRIGSLPCNHEFHVDCLKKWLKQNNHCPLCNGEGAELRGTEN